MGARRLFSSFVVMTLLRGPVLSCSFSCVLYVCVALENPWSCHLVVLFCRSRDDSIALGSRSHVFCWSKLAVLSCSRVLVLLFRDFCVTVIAAVPRTSR